MKNCNHIMGQVRATVMSLVAVVALFAAARMEASTGGNDTLMVYNSWEAIFDLIPDTIVANPEIKVRSEYDFEFKATSRDAKAVNKMLKNEAVAVCLGDTLWLINSDWLKRNFKGDCKHFSRYVPLYYTGKIAFVQFQRNNPTVGGFLLNLLVDGVLGADSGIGMGDGYNGETPKLYWIDFDNLRVREVNKNLLLELLEPYPDLLQRYTFRQYQDETYLINEFFLDYVNRLNRDPEVPYLF
ncbi:MAG: hypothetical protein II603_05820 [Muribaculaceae bacterium]|nr:hypothetical protein [Muribaculaceae bacterium]MBQ4008041.1 hypothetical protein [Muribaculaceae bacterium]